MSHTLATTHHEQLSSHESACRIVHELLSGQRHDPHTLLGIHTLPSGAKIVRLFRPGAQRIHIELYGYIVEMRRVHDAGLFEVPVSPDSTFKDYRVFLHSGLLHHDPYAFWSTFSDVDQYLFARGTHYELFKKMGGTFCVHQGIEGVAFTVWAPAARAVSVVGEFNHWDGRAHPMRSLGSSGVWELFMPGIGPGALYKFEIWTQDHRRLIKADPYAHESEMRPKTASRVANPYAFTWTDDRWQQKRRMRAGRYDYPIAVYEVHLGSFKRGHDGQFLSYRELAHELASYCEKMHYTHIELLPITEHPFDESWGYQVSGFFAPTSRFGSLEDFQYFVNYLHEHDIGIFLDWVPGHFPQDDFSLHRFDGTALYEHEDPRQGLHPHWKTNIFNFGRHEVTNFLIASALFWLEVMHLDGLRVDAVASMLYLDYGRDHGAWIANKFGHKENLEAIEWMKHVNSIISVRCPGVLMIAEESTAFAGITTPVASGGLGFDLKWNMGWMNDTLRYFHRDTIFRKYHQNELTFGLLYAFSERFQLVLSHDEVVHGKGSLLSKMPGDMWQKFANLRLLYSYMMCQPGKKLCFMGADIAQWNEWTSSSSIEWFLTSYPYHHGIQKCFQALNKMYRDQSALWADDFSFRGFEWVDFSDTQNSVLVYIRKHPGTPKALLCVHNFTPTYYPEYEIPLRHVRGLREILNTDDMEYGGSGKTFGAISIFRSHACMITLPPLATVVYEIEWE